MTTWAYIAFVFAGTVLGGFLGALAHYWRAHATMYAEDLGFDEPLVVSQFDCGASSAA